MKQRLASLLRQLSEWLDPTPAAVPLPWTFPASDTLAAARVAVAAASLLPNTSSMKGAVAMKALMVQLPEEKHRMLRLAIELAVQELKK